MKSLVFLNVLFVYECICEHCDVNHRNLTVIFQACFLLVMTSLLCTERQNLSCLQILTSSILMAKMQRQEKAWYVQGLYLLLFIFHTC